MAINRTSKFAFAQLYSTAGKMETAQFLLDLVATLPYAIHTVLTYNGIQFTHCACDIYAFQQFFDRVCGESGIEHRLTKVKHLGPMGRLSG
ncbi:hypothetical protein NB706_000016 [Xanthomonas sacchari]|nr:hypothetical protein [Xanthomonas sacchari]